MVENEIIFNEKDQLSGGVFDFWLCNGFCLGFDDKGI